MKLFACRFSMAAILWAALCCSLLSSTARANVALMMEPTWSNVAEEDKSKLLGGMKAALKAQKLALADNNDRDAAIAGEPQLRDCTSELCMERLGRVLGTQVVLHFSVKQDGSGRERNYQLEAEVLDVEVGSVGARQADSCKRCTVDQAAQKLAELASHGVQACRDRPRGMLEIKSTPAGASVFVDGTELGVTPYKRPAFTGEHKLTLRHVGYSTQQIEVTVSADKPQQLDVALRAGDAGPEPTAATDKRPVYKKWWFWVAIGGAVVAAGAITAGVVLGTRNQAMTPSERTLPMYTLMFTF